MRIKGPQGRGTPFGPVADERESICITPFAKQVLLAAAQRSGRPRSNVVDLLLRKHGGSVTAEDFVLPSEPAPETAATD